MCQICIQKKLMEDLGGNPEALAAVAASALAGLFEAGSDTLLLTNITHTLLLRYGGSAILSKADMNAADQRVRTVEAEQGEGSCLLEARWLGKRGEGDLQVRATDLKTVKRDSHLDKMERDLGIPLREMVDFFNAHKAAQATQPGSETHVPPSAPEPVPEEPVAASTAG